MIMTAASAVTQEFIKATTALISEFPTAAREFVKKSAKSCQPQQLLETL
jgi:hypothetical protein